MKKPLLLLLLIPFFAGAQKLEKPVIDPISGDTSRRTKFELIYNKFSIIPDVLYVLGEVSSKDDTKLNTLVFRVIRGYGGPFMIGKGGKAYLKMTDGSIDTLRTNFDAMSEPGKDDQHCLVEYIVMPKDEQFLKSKDIAFIRFEATDRFLDYEIKPRNADVIKRHLLALDKSPKNNAR